MTGLVLAGSAVGCFLGGFLAKWTAEARWGRAWGRRWLGFGALLIGAAFLWLSVQMESPLASSLCAAMVGVTAFSQQTNWWAAVTETSGRHIGAIFGLLNMLGSPGAAASQLFMGIFADYRKAGGFTGRALWDPAFYIYSGVLLAGACIWLLVNVDRPIVPEEISHSESDPTGSSPAVPAEPTPAVS